MKTILEQMIENYHPKNIEEKKNAIKEVMQEIVLCALSKAGFFDEAAFYGGTALRIFYGLDRFSEDLDFALLTKNENFELNQYLPTLKTIVNSFGLNVDIEIKTKSIDSDIQSAFLKAGTIEHFLLFYPDDLVTGISKNEKVKIKFKILRPNTPLKIVITIKTKIPLTNCHARVFFRTLTILYPKNNTIAISIINKTIFKGDDCKVEKY